MTPSPTPDWVEWVGYVAACLTTASFLPQALLTLRTRDVSGISLGMYSAFTVGVVLWLVYGLSHGAWPIILSNLVTLALASVILGSKIRIERQRRLALRSDGMPAK